MTEILINPYRGKGLPDLAILPRAGAETVARLLAQCPAHAPTPLLSAPALAEQAGVAALWVKDERGRMGLGSFKALGAAFAIAQDAVDAVARAGGPLEQALAGRCYVTASAGNHGLSVAAGARLFGAEAVIYLSDPVPEAFAQRLRAKGARGMREGAVYEDSMAAAEAAAAREGWTLLSDSSWPGYAEMPLRVMEGYVQMAAEAAGQLQAQAGAVPSHILLQAGVGGLAAAVAAHARLIWGAAPVIAVVEPAAAPALMESIRAGHVVTTTGPVSAMGRLDCKTPSEIALAGLARDADVFVTLTEEEAAQGVARLAAQGLATTPSGGAGRAALWAGRAAGPGLDGTARVLTRLSEGPEDV